MKPIVGSSSETISYRAVSGTMLRVADERGQSDETVRKDDRGAVGLGARTCPRLLALGGSGLAAAHQRISPEVIDQIRLHHLGVMARDAWYVVWR